MTHSNTAADLMQAQKQQCGGVMLVRRLGLLLPLLFCALVFGGAAAADDDVVVDIDDGNVALLRAFWSQTPAAHVEFRQRVYDDDGELLSDGGGAFWFARGGRFRVEYQSPEELLLVSNGESFWSYEKDLQQVITRPLSSLGGGFLAALSAGKWEELQQLYDLSGGGKNDDDLRIVKAQSRNKEDSVRRILFGFGDDGGLRRLDMHDAFGGIVRVDIITLTIGADDKVFDFVPPPDAEIIRDQ